MRPFNLAEAIAGKPICTREGRKVKFINYVSEAKPSSIVVLIEGKLEIRTKHGTSGDWFKSDDILMAPNEGWVPMAELNGEVVLRHHKVFNSEEDAYESHQTKAPYDKIFTGKVTWEE